MKINKKISKLQCLETSLSQTIERARNSVDIIDSFFDVLFKEDIKARDSDLDYLLKDLDHILKRFAIDAENKWRQILNQINKI
tara:strand:+ start:444 stop:692 length:249 start_codon:yes stop_codon:yes gene_type:complete